MANPDVLLAEYLAGLFREHQISYSNGETGRFAEIEVGFQKQPAFFPYLSVHTGRTDFPVSSMGQGSGAASRDLSTEFVLAIRLEHFSPEQGYRELTDLKWSALSLITEHSSATGSDVPYRYLKLSAAELTYVTPEEVDAPLDWGFAGMVLIAGKAILQ